MLKNFGKVLATVILSGCLVATGCANRAGTTGNMTLVLTSASTLFDTKPAPASSTLAASSTKSGTINSTPATPSYKGQVIPAQPGEGPAEIWVDKYDCSPNVLIVKAGTTVTWMNLDYIAFTVVSEDGLFAGNMTPDKGTWSYLFANPGSFGYSVDPYNAELQGEVIVVK
jgi:plastocyanin